MKLADFNYQLPKELIAQEPVDKRENSRLLILKCVKSACKASEHNFSRRPKCAFEPMLKLHLADCKTSKTFLNTTNNHKKSANELFTHEECEIIHDHFYNLPNYLNKDDVLVINETKVLKNKLVGKKETGTPIEVIIEKKLKNNTYECRLRGKKPLVGNIIVFADGLKAEIINQDKDLFYLKFNKSFNLDKIGELPTPFYVKKHLDNQARYQTVFAKKKGSLAAPTASLHFSKELLGTIKKKGVKIAKITLHISFSTFLPIKEQDFTQHKMHEEYYEVSKGSADTINNCKGHLICVGTTTIRTLEACADATGKIKAGKGSTDIFIYPGYTFKSSIKATITNFHLPESSLLLLVCAFYGKDNIFKAYHEAIKEKYKFYSFGDVMLLVK